MIWADNKERNFEATAAPYEALAVIYDQLMEHVNYARWADYIVFLLKEYCSGKHIIELACGTGAMAEKLTHAGFRVDGYDRSPQMIDAAKKREQYTGLSFRTGAFEDFPLDKQYDAAICLYDSINYLMQLNEVTAFIARVNEVLKPEGVFIFDICTRFNSYFNFRGFVDEGVLGGYRFHRYSDYNPATHIHINNFIVSPADNPQIVLKEQHRQFIYSVRQIQNAIAKTGMKLEAKFDNTSFNPPRLKSLRIHFVARKV